MTYQNEIQKVITYIKTHNPEYNSLKDLLDLCIWQLKDNPDDRDYCFKYSRYIKECAKALHISTADERYGELHWQTVKFESPYLFESFIYYMEKNRSPSKKFYEPRKKTLNVVVQDLQELEDRKGGRKFYGLSMPSRVGKAIAYDTPVLTNHGWKKHGELTILDEVIGIDGDFKKILAIHNPCEMEYKVTFSDGEEILCHGNHEWRVFDRHLRKIIDKETKTISETYKEKDGRCRYYIPNKEIVCGSHAPLWVSPYVLGAWLGNGRNQNPDICGAESDYAIIQKIIDDGYELAWDTKHTTTGVRYYGFRGLREDLQHYGMCHSRRRTPKYIPDEYLIADVEQRLELLAGLLDTDGYLNKKEHRYQFTTNESNLRDDFVSLVNTFGWRTCVTRRESGMSSSGIYANKPYWIVSFNPTIHIPCQLERKKLCEFSKQQMVSIEKVEKIPTGIGGNCITVEDGIYCVGRTLKPTHNSTICIFFLCWIALKRPNSHSAMGGHSGILAKGFYKELLNLMTTPEYTFKELFDYVHPEYADKPFPTDKSADEFTITLGDPDRFATITCRGIDGTWTGAIDVSSDGYLYVDDLVRDREHSLSPRRMEGTFQEYLNKMVDRKNDGARELMVGTLWSIYDPLQRIKIQNKNNPEYQYRKIPALDENDESNFNYEISGFSTQYYHEMRERLDKAEWMAKFQQEPFVREGLVFPIEELRTFDNDNILPEGNYKVIAVCDPAFGGGDSLSMPICAVHENGKKYIIDWIFNKGTQAITVPLIIDKIIEHRILEITLEKNAGGNLLRDIIEEKLKEKAYFSCKITAQVAPNKISKEDKIVAYSDYVKANFIFLLPNRELPTDDVIPRYRRSDEYNKAIEELALYTSEGKNLHDDSPDSMAQLAILFEKRTRKPTIIMPSPI